MNANANGGSRIEEAARLIGCGPEKVRESALVMMRLCSFLLDVDLSERKVPERMSYAELSDVSGVSEKTLRRRVAEGSLRVRYPNARKRFHRDDVERFLRGMAARKA